jgi:hypothetical protein
VLDNLLSAPVPPMPNNVPPLNEDANRGGKILTMRERMEEHRKNPGCAACHKIMDPIGLSMENFDAVGAGARATATASSTGLADRRQGQLLDGPRSTASSPCGGAAPAAGAVCRHGDGKADDLRARPGLQPTTCRRSAQS